jgi:plastocyanin
MMNTLGWRLFGGAACLLIMAGFVGACGSDTKPSSAKDTSTIAGAGGVAIKSFAFTTHPVNAGAMVNVSNADPTAHTVSADNGEFNVQVDPSGKTSFTAPAKPGTYAFHCNIHTTMKATLTVS